MEFAQQSIDFSNKTILIVEDDIINYKYLCELLRIANANIVHAACGEEALKLLSSQHFDAILLDIKIPPPNGLELAKYIRKMFPNRIPIIAQTACAFNRDKDNCMAAGCDEFLAKPFPVNELFEKLAKYFN